ncbi:MAG: hypothetical protein N2510_02175 [Ignavibacteria bacterium]|nr:hypothetical protein [Ignavibacteria bacterium]
MKDSKLTELLRAFSRQEITEFEKFLKSPFFNNSKIISDFFRLITKYYPAFDNEYLTHENIHKTLYPGEKFDKRKIFSLLSRTSALAEDFLIYKRFGQMDVSRKNMLMKEFAERNLDNFFTDALKKAETSINEMKVINNTSLYLIHSFKNTRRDFLESKQSLGKREEFFKEIESEYEAFLNYSLYKILKYLNELHTHTKVLNLEHKFKMQNEVIKFIEGNPPVRYPVIMIYYHLVKMQKNESDIRSYYEVSKLLNSSYDTIDKDDLKEIYAVMYNFTLLHAIKDNKEMAGENFRLVKEMIAKGIHPRDGNFFAENSFITIFRTAMIEKDYEWGYDFLNQYIERIPPDKRENVYTLCSGIYAYYKEKYEEALEKLASVKVSDFIYGIRVKNFQIRTLWMLGRYEDVWYMIDSFRHTISSNPKIPQYQKVRFMNFLNFTQRAARAILSEKKDRINSLICEIESHPVETFENKTWLLENLRKLI